MSIFRGLTRVHETFPRSDLGVVYHNLGNYKKAIEAYKQAIKSDPEFEFSYSNLGSVYRRLGQFDEAIDAFNQAIRVNPEYANAYYNLGVIVQ